MDTTIFSTSNSMLDNIGSLLSGMPEISITYTTDNFKELCCSFNQHLPDIAFIDFRSTVRQIDTIGIDRFKSFRSFSSRIPIISFTEFANVFGYKLSAALGVKAHCMTSIEAPELSSVIKDDSLTETYIQIACREKLHQQFLFLQKYALKDRQLDVLSLMLLGLSNEEISLLLHISYDTVRSHVKKILERLSARDRARAISIVFHDIMIECVKYNANFEHPFY